MQKKAIIVVVFLALIGCSQSKEKVEIKPAPKQSNDATQYAQRAWELMNHVEPYVENHQDLEKNVRKPIRELSTDWKINVKMGDSVTEGRYALCRKALTDLETWSRAVEDQSIAATYKQDKSECHYAIEHPELGNTPPKREHS